MLTLPEFIDRKRRLEVEIAYAVETLVAEFGRDTSCDVEAVTLKIVTGSLWTSKVEVKL